MVRLNAGGLDPVATLTEQHGHLTPREPIEGLSTANYGVFLENIKQKTHTKYS